MTNYSILLAQRDRAERRYQNWLDIERDFRWSEDLFHQWVAGHDWHWAWLEAVLLAITEYNLPPR